MNRLNTFRFSDYGFVKLVASPSEQDFDRFFRLVDLVKKDNMAIESLLSWVYIRQIGKFTYYYIERYIEKSASGLRKEIFHFYKANYYKKDPAIKNYQKYFKGPDFLGLTRSVARQCFYLKERE